MGSLIGSNVLDMGTLEKNLNDDPTQAPKPVTVEETPAQAKTDAAGGGRLKGWKERLAKLREQKEKEKEQIDESKQEESKDENLEKIKDIFAPAKGLERDSTGKIKVDKEQVQTKAEPVFEKKSTDLVQQELQKKTSTKEPVDKSVNESKGKIISPAKPRMTLMERQAKEAEEKKAKLEEQKAAGGIRAPSRLTKPTQSASMKAAEDRKAKLLEKQKQVNAKLEEKAKAEIAGTGRAGASSRQSIGGGTAGGTTSRISARSRLQGTVSKVTEEAKTSRLSGTSRLTSTRTSIKPATDTGQSGTTTSRVRGTSATKKDDIQFGRGRNTSNSRDQKISGLNQTRGSSRDKGPDVQFGAKNRQSSTSKERTTFGFGKSSSASTSSSTAEVKLDPSMTTIKKTELKELQDTAEKKKKVDKDLEEKVEELYNLNLKMKGMENKFEILKRDHKDELDKQMSEMTENNKKAYEDLIKKHSDERNDLIAQSNKSNDAKLNELQREHEVLKKEKEELEEKLKQTIEDMTENHTKELEEAVLTAEANLNEVKADLDQRNEETQKSLDELNVKMVEALQKVTNQKQKIEELEEKNQANQMDLEANQIEIDMLKEEKAELLAEMTEQSKVETDEVLDSLSNEEIKQQNRKLRQAVTSLAQNFEAEREKLMKQIKDEEGKKKIIAEYEKKLQDMDVLLEELDRKESELAEMKIENEMCLEYETMVEEMAQEILKKEEENEELEKKLKSIEDILSIQEGYGEQLEQYNQEITEELAEKEAEMSQIEQQKIEDEELLLDLEDENQKYRDKVQLQTKTIKELTEQLAQFTDNTDDKSKFSTLVEKQNALVKQIQENEKTNLDQKLKKIDYHWDNLLRSKIIEGIIPPRLQEYVHFDSLEKLNLLNKTMYRAMLMIRYICEKQMPNIDNMYAGSGEEEIRKKLQFVKMMIILSEQAVMFVNYTQRILICLNNMSVEQYVKATTTFMAWQKLDLVGAEMSQIIERLKDENISLVFDTSILEGYIKQVAELHFKIEKMFIEKTPEELQNEKPQEKGDDDKQKYQLTPAQLERQKLVQQCVKLDLRNQCMKMCYAIVALKVIMGGMVEGGASINQNFIKKATLIYGRLLEVIFKIDHIDSEDNGKQYLNLGDLVTDKRLSEKFEVIQVIWSEVADPDQIQKDWNSLLDAIQRDISQLFNDYKFKRLIKQIEQQYKDNESSTDLSAIASIDEIFFIDRFKNDSSPWMEISKKIRLDIENSEQLKGTIQTLNQRNKKTLENLVQNERTINMLKVTGKSNEKRLAEAHTKIEELNSIKGENEQLVKKNGFLTKQVEVNLKEIESLKNSQDQMQKKYEELEKKVSEGPALNEAIAGEGASTHDQMLGQYRKSRDQNKQSRQSRTSTWFQELAKTSMLGGRKLDSTMTPQSNPASRGGNIKPINSQEVQRHIQATEDAYQNIIYQLQLDRMKLRGKDVNEKLNKLIKHDSAMNEYIKSHSDQHKIQTRLTKNEQNVLTKAIENVDVLKKNVKIQMATIKVVDLKKKQEEIANAQQEEKRASEMAKSSVFASLKNKKALAGQDPTLLKPDCVKTNININYMIQQARDQVNTAIQTLMSKDSKLSALHIEKMQKQVERDIARDSTDEDSLSDQEDELLANPDLSEEEKTALVLKLREQKSVTKEEKKKKSFKNVIKIGQIHIQSDDKNDSDKVLTKDIVFNVKSLRSLQRNMGVFSV